MLNIGGCINVIRRSILNLKRKLCRPGEAEYGMDAGGNFKLRSQFLKHFVKVCRSGNRDCALIGLTTRICSDDEYRQGVL